MLSQIQTESLLSLMRPELILGVVACALFLLGVSSKTAARRMAPWLALGALLVVFFMQLGVRTDEIRYTQTEAATTAQAANSTIHIYQLAVYIKLLAAG